jgi:hypothetical protein
MINESACKGKVLGDVMLRLHVVKSTKKQMMSHITEQRPKVSQDAFVANRHDDLTVNPMCGCTIITW